jgi:mannosyltransferase OCH1-like enzyme
MIPKIIHIAWNDKQVLESTSPLIVNGLRKLVDLNPDWVLQISDDADIDAYLQDKMAEDYALAKDLHIVAKTDIWRLYKMFLDGGLYVDIDRLCNVPLSTIVDEKTRQVLPTCRNFDFSHDMMLSAPHNPIYRAAIRHWLARRRAGADSIYFLGAQTYMHAITETLFGGIIDTNPGEKAFEQMRAAINMVEGLKCIPENPPHQTTLFKGYAGDWEKMKRDFYAANGLRHWTGEW